MNNASPICDPAQIRKKNKFLFKSTCLNNIYATNKNNGI